MNSLSHAAHGLGPAKGFLDFLPVPLGQGIARMLRGAPVDGGHRGPSQRCGLRSSASGPGSSLRRCGSGGACRASAASLYARAAVRCLRRSRRRWWQSARIIVMRWRSAVLWLKALHGCPRLDQSAVYREVFIRKQRLDLRVRQGRGHHFARHVSCQQPVAVLGEHGRNP